MEQAEQAKQVIGTQQAGQRCQQAGATRCGAYTHGRARSCCWPAHHRRQRVYGVAHKTGELPGLGHDAGIILAALGPYAVAALVRAADCRPAHRSHHMIHCQVMLRWLALAAFVLMPASPAPAQAAPIAFSRAAFGNGSVAGTQVDAARVSLTPGETSGRWTSARIDPGFGFNRLVASWNADTPADSSIKIEVQATTDTGALTDWYTLGIWAADDHA